MSSPPGSAPTPLTDVEITKLCAEAMELSWIHKRDSRDGREWVEDVMALGQRYNPLDDDAQAMQLVKRLKLRLSPPEESDEWIVMAYMQPEQRGFRGDADLNHAICECVAYMEARKYPDLLKAWRANKP